ncbi:MAG: 4-hydroxy-3-methylbut-2-enyl diphosphate reductase [SAR324 cluster bacterium]|nr:4-hydroxy-3-methylbut-2-enyl diphosphate reductase [SAR324 cluster bacterium]
MTNNGKKLNPFKLLLASPRGFCAGVDRAILIVEEALRIYGAPIYAKHEIVHNKNVVDRLTNKGVIFIEDLAFVPPGARLIFSAHGVSPEVRKEAFDRKLKVLDATCPLVTKVHKEAIRFDLDGYRIILIGHRDHVEVIGTVGHAPDSITIISDIKDVDKLTIKEGDKVAYITQTTLSLDDTKDIVRALRVKYPNIKSTVKDDICYATTNRQGAVKAMIKLVQAFLVVGSDTSSNTKRLVEVAQKAGVPSFLVHDADDVDPSWINGLSVVGLSAGASAPESVVQEVITRILSIRPGEVEEFLYSEENIKFALPLEIRQDSKDLEKSDAHKYNPKIAAKTK